MRLTLLFLLARGGMASFTYDEAWRAKVIHGWPLQYQWFTQWDGIWLTGGLIWHALPLALPFNPQFCMLIGVLLAHVLNLLGMEQLGREVGGPRCGRWLALAWAVAAPPVWFGQGPLVENVMVGMGALALAAGFRFMRAPRGKAGCRSAAWCAGLTFLTLSMHYTAWMAAAGILPVVAIGLGWNGWRAARATGPGKPTQWRRAQARLAGFLAISAGAAAFPLLWMLGSTIYLGHPLQFLRNQTVAIATPGSGSWADYLIYPQRLATLLGPFIWLLPAAAWLAWSRAKGGTAPMGGRITQRRRGNLWALLLLGLAVGAVLLAVAGAAGYAVAWRNVILLDVLAVASGVLALDLLLPSLHRPHRNWLPRPLWAAALAGLLGLGWLGYNLRLELRHRDYGQHEMPHSIVALGAWLQQEFKVQQTLRVSEQTQFAVYAPTWPDWKAQFGYLAGHPAQFHVLEQYLDAAALQGFDYLITRADVAVPPGWRTVCTVQEWRVLAAPGS